MKRLVTAGTLFVLLAGCDGGRSGEQARKNFSQSFPGGDIRQIKLESIHGDVEVRPSADSQIHLVVDAHFEGHGAKELANGKFVEIDVDNGVLRIIEKGRLSNGKIFNWSRTDRFVDYTIEAPSNIALSLSNVSGEIEVADARATAVLSTVNGEIAVNARNASVEANSVNGSIEANFSENFLGAKLSTVNGPVEITVPPDATFVCNVSQVNGGFESNIPMRIRRRGGINAVVGSGTASHTLEVSTVNGDVSLLREKGSAAVETVVEKTTADDDEVVMPELPPLPDFHGSGGGQPPHPPAPPKPQVDL
jgi:hypothetical protein